MNRLVLIGNGFDLAHGLKTKYEHFIDWYWEEWGKRLMRSSNKVEEDELCSFKLKEDRIAGWYLVRDWHFQRINMDEAEFVEKAKKDRTLCEFKYKSYFFEQINKSIESKGWVDIEREYYRQLNYVGNHLVVNRSPNYLSLNCQLEFLRGKLIEYLKIESEKDISVHEDIKEKMFCPIFENEVSVKERSVMYKERIDGHSHIVNFLNKKKQNKWTPWHIMLLNFNYTTTPEHYMEGHSNVIINYIHGRLDDPQSVIFGYGDELDENYNKLKEQEDDECLRYVKSIKYLERDNYRRMLEFIESDLFQVVIMGHSCGNSDRTLLNTLFEHPNCVSIKPYYYISDNQQDKFAELSINIHRNFNDMKQMRDRVVNKTYTEPLTKHTK